MTLSLLLSTLGSALERVDWIHAGTARRVMMYVAWLGGSALLVAVPRYRTVAAIRLGSIVLLYATPVEWLLSPGRDAAVFNWLLNATILIAPLVQSVCLVWIARALLIEVLLPRIYRTVVLGAAALGALGRFATMAALLCGCANDYGVGKRAGNLTMLAMCIVAAVGSARLLRATSRAAASELAS